MKTFAQFVAEAKPKLPPVASGHIRLYRGDSSKIDAFDTAKTNDTSLFGRGIYLTNNVRIANDYKVKGGTPDVLMSFSGYRTKDAVKERYVERVAKYTDVNGKEDPYGQEVKFSNGQSWNLHDDSNPVQQKERPIRMAHAERKWNELMKTHEVRFKVGGEAVIQKKQKLSTTGFAVFDIPEAYVRKIINAEESIHPRVLAVITDNLRRADDRPTARDIEAFVKNNEWGTPTFREIYTNIGPDSPLRHDEFVIARFIEDLQALGVHGIEYAGGVTMGGGVKHRAFVFWDSEELNTYRIA